MSVDNSGIKALQPPDTDAADWQIGPAGTYVGKWSTGFDGMTGLAGSLQFTWTSGGTAIRAFVQSSLDDGNTAYDVYCVLFATASRTANFAVTQSTTATPNIPTDAGASVTEGVVAPILGNRLRLKLVVTGTYLGSVISARVQPS